MDDSDHRGCSDGIPAACTADRTRLLVIAVIFTELIYLVLKRPAVYAGALQLLLGKRLRTTTLKCE